MVKLRSRSIKRQQKPKPVELNSIKSQFSSNLVSVVLEFRICGRKNLEEWSFLPGAARFYEDIHWDNTDRILFDKNFVFIMFKIWEVDKNTGDLLILNLVSRKQFWMKKAEVCNQIKTNIPDYPADLSRIHLHQQELRLMVVGENGIQIKYQVDTFGLRAVGIFSITNNFSPYIGCPLGFKFSD